MFRTADGRFIGFKTRQPIFSRTDIAAIGTQRVKISVDDLKVNSIVI